MKHLLTVLCLFLLASTTAFAMSLQEAKQQGLVGERNDGYIGYVVTPADSAVAAMVKNVNSKRRAKFADTAKKNNLQTEQVAQRFYQRAVVATAPGHYYQDAAGAWVKK
jgi:uncharacterized protein YdbL (DUF1318 family)